MNPDEYGGWTFARLAEVLADHGLTARKYNGTMVVRTAEVTRALSERGENHGSDDV